MSIAGWLRRGPVMFVFLAVAFNIQAQTTVINGVVRDAKSNLPLASVTVTIKNLRGGVTTDSAGNFSINTDKPVTQLLFSIVGYKNQTVSVKQTTPKPKPAPDTTKLHPADSIRKSYIDSSFLVDSSLHKPDTVSRVTDTSVHITDTAIHRLDSVIRQQADTTLRKQDTSSRATDTSVHINDTTIHRLDSVNLQRNDTALHAKDSAAHLADTTRLPVADQNKNRPETGNGHGDTLFVYMQPNSSLLKSVTIKDKRQKYRNKDNPAVELIRHVIDNKPKNRMEAYEYAEYERYEKMQLSLNSVSEKVKNSKLTKKYHFLFENADTTLVPGQSLLPVYLEEKIAHVYYRSNPQKTKTVIIGSKRVDFGEFVDMRGVSNYLNRLYADVNIYDNNISLFTNLFLSPIAEVAPTFYMFFISDTVVVDGQKLIRLTFRPRNPNDFLFRGTMYITLDGNYAVQKLNMLTSNNINLNFVRELRINQDFEKRNDGRYLLSKSDIVGDFGILKKGSGVYGQRVVSFKNFVTNKPIPDSVFKGPALVELKQATDEQDTFWLSHRHDSLSTAESKVYANIDSLKNMPSFRRIMDWATLLLAGYKQAGFFEIGPASTFYSFNPVEGFRLRFGGRTTPKLSNRLYFETYGAYGFKDEKWKYFFSTTYSLNNKSVYGFPLNYIRASYQRETKIPGQELQFVQEDNLLLSFKRGNNDKWLYNDYFKLDYVYEFGNHFSYDFGVKYWKQEPGGNIAYLRKINNLTDSISSLTTGEASVQFRWAPNEQFYQGKLYRIPIINKYPVFTLRYIAGIKGLFGGNYNYQNITLNIFKRVYVSQFGYSDITLEGGYLFGKVPWPLADLPHANQTYAYQLNSYNLMNFLEFASDHYVSVDWDHYFNGFFFNKIPLFKKLKWREVIEGKLLYGALRNENNPLKSPGLLTLPDYMFPFDNRPYIEAGFGIANIFKLVRVDFIRRFTYLEHPGIPDPPWGIRFRTKFDF